MGREPGRHMWLDQRPRPQTRHAARRCPAGVPRRCPFSEEGARLVLLREKGSGGDLTQQKPPWGLLWKGCLGASILRTRLTREGGEAGPRGCTVLLKPAPEVAAPPPRPPTSKSGPSRPPLSLSTSLVGGCFLSAHLAPWKWGAHPAPRYGLSPLSPGAQADASHGLHPPSRPAPAVGISPATASGLNSRGPHVRMDHPSPPCPSALTAPCQ